MNSYIQTKSRDVHISLAVMLSVVLLMAIMLLTMPTVHAAEEDVETWTASGTCEWGIDPDGCLWIRPTDGVSGTLAFWSTSYAPWYAQREQVKSVVVKPGVTARTACRMFLGCSNCTQVDLSGLDFSRVSDTWEMFLLCDSLTEIDLSSLDMRAVQRSNEMLPSHFSENTPYGGATHVENGGANVGFTLIVGDNTRLQNAFSNAWCVQDTWSHTNSITGEQEQKSAREMNELVSLDPGAWVLSERLWSSYVCVLDEDEQDNISVDSYWSGLSDSEWNFSVPVGKTLYRATNASAENTEYSYGEENWSSFDLDTVEELTWARVAVPDSDRTISGEMTEFGEYSVYKISLPSYTIAINRNDNSGETSVDLCPINRAYRLPDSIQGASGRYHIGWNTAADGSGTHYDLGSTIPANTYSDGDVLTLYAEWSPIFTIVYNSNDGSDETETVECATASNTRTYIAYDYQGTNGKYLVGWNTAADGTGTHYDMGQEIPANTFSEGDVLTLYGEWADEPVSTDPSLVDIIYLSDLNDIRGTLFGEAEMIFDPDSSQFVHADASGTVSTQASGAFSFSSPVIAGMEPTGVYYCTNYLQVMMGSGDLNDLIWELTSIDPTLVTGTLSPIGEIKIYAVVYVAPDPRLSELNVALVLDENASVPSVTTALTLTPGTGIAAVPGTSMAVIAPSSDTGVTGAPTIGSAVFAPGDETVTSAEGVTIAAGQKAVVKNVEIDFRDVTFAQPGIFRYLITEPSTGSGLVYDTQLGDTTNGVQYQRVLDVYVQRVDDPDTGATSYQIAGFVLHEVADAPAEGATTAADKSVGFVNEYETVGMTLACNVAGNQSSIDKYFAYTITMSNPNSSEFTVAADWTNAAAALNPAANPATKYDTATITAANTAEWTSNADGSLSKTIYLRNGQKVELDGIPAGATYSVSVADEDYSPSWTAGDGSGSNNTTGNRVLNALEDVVFTLTREGVVPTGIMLSAVPGLIIMAGALVAVVAMRKREEERTEA